MCDWTSWKLPRRLRPLRPLRSGASIATRRPQRAALRVKAESRRYSESVASFLEESIVRRELSDNFCYYQRDYDSLAGAAGWARESLELHASDEREQASV